MLVTHLHRPKVISRNLRQTQTFCIFIKTEAFSPHTLSLSPAVITCPPPPPISRGRHDGEGVGIFAFNSTVTYSCDPSLQLVGNGSIRCTSRDKTSGAWSGAAPECKGGFIPVQCLILFLISYYLLLFIIYCLIFNI